MFGFAIAYMYLLGTLFNKELKDMGEMGTAMPKTTIWSMRKDNPAYQTALI